MNQKLPIFEQHPWWEKTAPDPNDRLFSHLIDNLSAESADQPVDVALFGVPFDTAIRGRPGARFAPKAVREALAGFKSHCFESGPVDLTVRDLGDMALAGMTVTEAHEAVEAMTREIHACSGVPVAIGGDHSLSYPLCKPLIDAGTTAVINFDAHLDLRDVHKQPSSGTPFSRLFTAGLKGYYVIGVRDFDNSTHYYESAKRLDARIVPATQVYAEHMISIAEAALNYCRKRADNVYLSIDIDVIDQSEAPGVSAPTPAGLTVREVMVAVRHICKDPIVKAVDMMEVSPPLDESGQTAKAAAIILASALAGISARHRG